MPVLHSFYYFWILYRPRDWYSWEKKLEQNLDLAIDANICRVNGAPCGDTTIQLYKGCKESDKLKCRQNLLIFLKGSRKAKAALKQKELEYGCFQSVWNVRTRHMIPNLPSQYILMLLCCYQPDCCHPLCKHCPPTSPSKWYTGGPPITHLPLPVLDEQRLWGSECQPVILLYCCPAGLLVCCPAGLYYIYTQSYIT